MGLFDAFKKKVNEKAEVVNPHWAFLNSANLGIENLQVSDANGTVTVSGSVENGEVAAQAEAMLKERGVGSVTNNIAVRDLTDLNIRYRVATNSSNLNCRKGPSTDNEIVGKFPKDAVVQLVRKYNNTWHEVRDDKISGFCHTDYLEEVAST